MTAWECLCMELQKLTLTSAKTSEFGTSGLKTTFVTETKGGVDVFCTFGKDGLQAPEEIVEVRVTNWYSQDGAEVEFTCYSRDRAEHLAVVEKYLGRTYRLWAQRGSVQLQIERVKGDMRAIERKLDEVTKA